MLLKQCYKCRPEARLLLRTLSKANEAVLTVAPGSGSQSASCSSSAGPHNATSQLSSADLHFYAKLARLSGLCYGHPEQLAAKLQVEGLQVEAQGQTSFTRWYVASGSLTQPLAKPTQLAKPPLRRLTTADTSSESSTESDADEEQPAASSRPDTNSQQLPLPEAQHCVVLLRGVVWKSEEVQVMNLWQNLLRFWPVTFADSLVTPAGALQAHAGMAEMANELYKQLQPHIRRAKDLGQTIGFGGHSLGGALATLVCCLARLDQRLPAHQVQCATFGSPPVLAHKDGKDGDTILQLLGLPAASLRSFVLDTDPIPRAMLSIDPTFAFVKQWPAVKSVMQLGRWFTGQQGPAPVSPARFMYNNVGEVYLIKWTVGRGHKVEQLAPAQVEEQLKLAVGQLMSRPPAAMQALLDHSHDSYEQDLEAAAKQLAQSLRPIHC
ncbi:hypothetical protein ABBQ38_004176 [Trebouxia sp. C0009 RCD-2024]